MCSDFQLIQLVDEFCLSLRVIYLEANSPGMLVKKPVFP